MTMVDVINKTLIMYGITAIISFMVAGVIKLLFMAVHKKEKTADAPALGKDAHI